MTPPRKQACFAIISSRSWTFFCSITLVSQICHTNQFVLRPEALGLNSKSFRGSSPLSPWDNTFTNLRWGDVPDTYYEPDGWGAVTVMVEIPSDTLHLGFRGFLEKESDGLRTLARCRTQRWTAVGLKWDLFDQPPCLIHSVLDASSKISAPLPHIIAIPIHDNQQTPCHVLSLHRCRRTVCAPPAREPAV